MLTISRYLIIIITLDICHIETKNQFNWKIERSDKTSRASESIMEFNEKANSSLNENLLDMPPKCMQMQCKIICFNGKASEIETDVNRVVLTANCSCSLLEELQIYSYQFPNGIIPRNFLSQLRHHIKTLYIASSNVTKIDGGAFGNSSFEKITFENLQLIELRRDFFQNVSKDFYSLAILQTELPIASIQYGFLDYIGSQIRDLRIQVGVSCVRNMTGANNLLSNLFRIDFSHNDFGSGLESNTFAMLSMVEHLDLSYSKITVLPKYIFTNFVSTLTFLDISNNHLKTISIDIFGWQKIRNDLRIMAYNNEWHCDCALHSQMKSLYGRYSPKIYCATPEENKNWSIFDSRLCENDTTTTQAAITTPILVNNTDEVVEAQAPPTNDLVELVCRGRSDIKLLIINVSKMEFHIALRTRQRIDVNLRSNDFSKEEYGIIWFNKVTMESYKMETNYKEYGLGCYGGISYRTTVNELLPNLAYTFCLVQKNRPTVSPFSCKSVHIPGNVQVHHVYLENDSHSTGISLAIFGVVLCTFVGILVSFLVLKHRPILLKGSKRVATTKGNCNEIVVLPKDCSLEELRIKEEMLARKFSKSLSNITRKRSRRDSAESNISYQSYMNANVYEELPPYINTESGSPSLPIEHDYITTVSDFSNAADLIDYAKIPYCKKRTSNDPLPELPEKEFDTSSSTSQLEANGILKYSFEWPRGYAFAYDCVV